MAEKEEQWRALRALEHIHRANRQMTNDDIAYLRLLADWHGRQAHDLLLTVAYDQATFIPWPQQGFRGLPMNLVLP